MANKAIIFPLPGDAEDKYMSHFNDTSDWARGSPLCLYGLSR